MAKYFRTNERIQSATLRVIDPEGNQLGVISRDEALKRARELNMDLIEIAPNVDPPVAKILDFQKFKYGENKKERAAKRNAREVEVKEIWLSPRIAEHDLKTRLNRAEEFLQRGDKVKLVVRFRGREMAHPEAGHQVLSQVYSFFGDRIATDRDARFEGRNLSVIFGLNKGSKKEENNAKNENQEIITEKN